MENNNRMTNIPLNNGDRTEKNMGNNNTNINVSSNTLSSATMTSATTNNINMALNRYNLAATNNNLSINTSNPIGNNDIKTSSNSPMFNSNNMSSLPSIESVTAAISSIGLNFNEDAIYAELTSQEDNRGYVRRPMNAFMVWSKQARRRIALAYPNLLNCEISKLLGREWGRMSSHEKEPYVALSTKLRENHNLLHPDYTYKPRKRRRKGESKSISDFDNGVDSNLINYSKGYHLQNPLLTTNLSSYYTNNGGQQRYITSGFTPSSTLTQHHSGTTNFSSYPTNTYKNYTTNNSINGLNVGLPPLNFQNGYMIPYQTNKMVSNNNPLNVNSSQFYPSGTSYYPTMNNNNSAANNNNNNSQSMQNYFNGFDSAKIGSILNIYGHEDDLTNTQTNDNTTTNLGITQNNMAIAQNNMSLLQNNMGMPQNNLGDIANFCSNTLFNTNNNNSMNGNPQNYYTMNSQSNVIQQLDNTNTSNMPPNEARTPNSGQSSSRQRGSSKNQ